MSQSILFVCLGNICRSPMAEGVMRHIAEAGWQLDSAGTGNWHAGEPPDARARATALAHGIDISAQRARQVRADDFQRFDLILAMDHSNLSDLERLRPPDSCATLAAFLPHAGLASPADVPDPWYTGDFEGTFQLIHQACSALKARLG